MPERLLCGQSDNAAAPSATAAELYVLSTGYGQPVGTDALLTVQTKDLAPAGPDSRVMFRRAMLTVLYDNACTVRVTPVVDFAQAMPVTTVTLAAPTNLTSTVLTVPMAHPGTYVRLLVEVIARSGIVEFGSNVRVAFTVRAGAYPQITTAGA